MEGFVEAHEKFAELGAQLLSMSVDSWACTNAFGNSIGAEFPMLGDWPLQSVSRAYSVYNERRYMARRVTFVMDADHIIRAVIEEEREVERHIADALNVLRGLAGLPPQS
jgi:thioredoxin-dependent peroxiredoxin